MEAPTHGLLAKITFKNCLLSLQKLKKDSLNKKLKNFLLGEAMLVKVLSFLQGLKFINKLALDYFIVLKSDKFDVQYLRISV